MTYAELLNRLGETIGVSIDTSANGCAGVVFGDDEVDFEISGPKLYLIADLVGAEGKEERFHEILAANHLSAKTGFAAIGIDTSRGVFTISRILEGDMDYEAFEEAVQIFVGAVRHWKNELAQ